MSFQALNAALSGLRVAQQQLNVISNNVANVGTEGYSRKILPQSTQVIAATGETMGVRAEAVIRSVDINLQRDLWTQVSAVSALDVKATYLNAIQTFHGPPDQEISIAADIAALKDLFAALSDTPDDTFAQQATLNQAIKVADKFNDFGDMLNQMRNDAQDDMESSVNTINDLLDQIAVINKQIKSTGVLGHSTAALQDQRDQAISKLSKELDISFFTRGDGVLVVQTSTGVQLADENVSPVYFGPSVVGATTYYPETAAGIFVGGNPLKVTTAFDITTTGVGGKLGGLIELRDEMLPQYQAQLDELAHKMALRFEAQGLRLFTDGTGQIPLDTPPDLTPLPLGSPIQPVAYIGFASSIQVNTAIIDDPSLLQQGTYTSDVTIPAGSNEVIRRVIEFTFGNINYQEAVGINDIRASLAALDLQEYLGIYSQNTIVAGPNLTQYTQIDSLGLEANDLITSLGADFFPGYPNNDEFQIQLYDRSDVAVPFGPISIDLSTLGNDPTYAIGAADPSGTLPDGTIDNMLDQLVAYLNDTIITQEGLLTIPTDIQARASINASGQLVLNTRGDAEFLSTGFANEMGDDAFRSIFGFSAQYFETEDPYFDVQIGNGELVRITIEPGDDENDLLDKLQKIAPADPGVAGLLVDDVAFANGFLSLRPGMDETTFGGPFFGGDMRFVGGPFLSDGTGVIGTAGDNLVTSLFGNASPITNVGYESETRSVAGVGSGVFVSFRNQLLGPGANIKSGILSATGLVDYAQKMINKQTQDLILVESSQTDGETLRGLIERQFLDGSAVNIDEELSNLIIVQTAYAAAARAVSAADQMFQELLDAVR